MRMVARLSCRRPSLVDEPHGTWLAHSPRISPTSLVTGASHEANLPPSSWAPTPAARPCRRPHGTLPLLRRRLPRGRRRASAPRRCGRARRSTLHAVATEAERRGWAVSSAPAALKVLAQDLSCTLGISEKGVHLHGPWEEQVHRCRNADPNDYWWRDRLIPRGPYNEDATGSSPSAPPPRPSGCSAPTGSGVATARPERPGRWTYCYWPGWVTRANGTPSDPETTAGSIAK